MSREARVQASLYISKGNLRYQSQPTAYTADMSSAKGPTPGGITVPTTGINVDLSELTIPGLIWMQNLDSSNYIRWGVHDGTLFHPVGRMLPGEIALFRIDESLGEEEAATGTGTTAPVNSLYLKAVGGSCEATVHAFEE